MESFSLLCEPFGGCLGCKCLSADVTHVFAAGKFSELSSKGFPQSNLLLYVWHGGVLVVGVDGGDLDVQVKDVFGKVVQLLWKIALETD